LTRPKICQMRQIFFHKYFLLYGSFYSLLCLTYTKLICIFLAMSRKSHKEQLNSLFKTTTEATKIYIFSAECQSNDINCFVMNKITWWHTGNWMSMCRWPVITETLNDLCDNLKPAVSMVKLMFIHDIKTRIG